MLTIVVSVLAALLTAAAVYPIFWTWYAPIPPAILVGGLTFYLLTRFLTQRVQKQMEGIVPLLQARQLEPAEALMDHVQRRYGKWVLLLDQQLSAQKGMLRYAQMKWAEARPLLEKGSWNNWQAHTALGAIDYREGDKAACWAHLDKAAKASPKEAMVYVVWAVLAVRDNDRDRALKALSQGLSRAPDSKLLKGLQKRVANKKKIDVKQLPQTWYHFFPEDLMKQMMVRGRKGGPPPLPEGVQPRFQQPPPQPRVSKKGRRG